MKHTGKLVIKWGNNVDFPKEFHFKQALALYSRWREKTEKYKNYHDSSIRVGERKIDYKSSFIRVVQRQKKRNHAAEWRQKAENKKIQEKCHRIKLRIAFECIECHLNGLWAFHYYWCDVQVNKNKIFIRLLTKHLALNIDIYK